VASHRWIEAGHPIIYTSTTPSLAALETLANLAHPTRFGERTIIETDLANDTQTVNIETTLHLREDAPANDPKTNTR
jgi:RES domain-containing protein